MAVLFAEVVARNPGGSPSKHEQQHQQQPSVAADPAVGRVLNELMHALKFELKFHGGPQPSQSGRNAGGCVTSGQRDGSAHILRCLKVWYDLPSDVFFSGMLSVDRFLAKMKVVGSCSN